MIESIIPYNKQELEKYLKDLQLICSLSSLFSDSPIPFIHYRITENLFCANFGADNLSRSDIAVDAKYEKYGVGIKTFLEVNRKTIQKVAEFNKQREMYKNLDDLEKIIKISELRNNRIVFTMRNYDIDSVIYHCVIRNEKGIFLFEEIMDLVDIANINLISEKKTKEHIYTFTDGKNYYQFNESKSTLYKRFNTKEYFASIPVSIFTNPMNELRKIKFLFTPAKITERLVLPLYSIIKEQKVVPEKSGLNQWNASGRPRNLNEVYIPFPTIVRTKFNSFFPNRDTPFNVMLPNGKILVMKVCQDGGKAVMSNPNKALGEWLLRDVLNLEEGELLTYEKLLEIGIDSVIFEKTGDSYKIDFAKIGTYEEFLLSGTIPDYE